MKTSDEDATSTTESISESATSVESVTRRYGR